MSLFQILHSNAKSYIFRMVSSQYYSDGGCFGKGDNDGENIERVTTLLLIIGGLLQLNFLTSHIKCPLQQLYSPSIRKLPVLQEFHTLQRPLTTQYLNSPPKYLKFLQGSELLQDGHFPTFNCTQSRDYAQTSLQPLTSKAKFVRPGIPAFSRSVSSKSFPLDTQVNNSSYFLFIQSSLRSLHQLCADIIKSYVMSSDLPDGSVCCWAHSQHSFFPFPPPPILE